jgi:hypothetical protein
MLKFTATGVMCRDCHNAELGKMWECPICHHVMTEEQSKGYRGCPTGFHLAQHRPVFAGVVLMQDGESFSHFETIKPTSQQHE